MARVDAKTVGAAALVALIGLNYGGRPGGSGGASSGVSDHAGETPDTTTPVQFDLDQEFAEELRPYLLRPGHAMRYLLATMPDPDSTTLRLYTDRAIDSLILAAFDNGFVLVHHWLPWRHSLENLDSQYAQRKSQLVEFKERARLPGILIFERKEELLITFVVPEHPSAGIKRDVMRRAVRYVFAPEKAANPNDNTACTGEGNRAPLVHTFFTGSLESLDEWFESDLCAAKVISRVVSGAVSGLSTERRGATKGVLTHVPYHWARVQLGDLKEQTQSYLTHYRGSRQSEITNLTEDSTGFGKSVTATDDMTFPWQISRVRNAMPEPGAQGSGLFGLPLKLRDPRKPHGALPTFAPEQTPAVEEVVLAQITARMERITADYVFVTATDPLDLVFLSRLLRTANPGQRIIVNSPDMMLLRASEVAPGTGILVPATFPLSNHLLLDDQPSKVFDSEVSAAIFTAARDAIDNPTRVGRGPLQKRSSWLMTMGRNGFWPVALLEEGDSTTAKNDRPALSAIAGYTALFSFCIGWMGMLMAARYQWFNGLADFRAKHHWPGWTLRASSLTRVTSAIAVMTIVCAMPLWFPHRQDAGWFWSGFFWAAMASLTVAGFLPWWRRRMGLRRHWRLAALALFPITATLLAVVFFWAFPIQDPHDVLRFFLIRSQDYLNGVAPLLPVVLLLAGYTGCAWASHLASIATTERFVTLGAPAHPPANARQKFSVGTAMAALAISFLTFAAIWRPLHSLEPQLYDVIYLLIAAGLMAATLYACFDMIARWSALKRFLDRMELHPLRLELTEMPFHKESEPIWESNPRRRSTVFYGRASDCLRRLQILGGGSDRIDESILAIRQFLDSKRGFRSDHRRRVEQTLSKLAVELSADLNREDGPWQCGASDLLPSEKAPPVDRLKQEFLAVRLAAFLRSRFLVLRVRMTAMVAGFVALTLSLNSYCFGPERIIQAFTLVLLVALGAAVVMVFGQLHNNPALQRMSGAKAGEIDWGFWGKAASAAALPILSILASYTPALGNLLGSWLQPALEAVAR